MLFFSLLGMLFILLRRPNGAATISIGGSTQQARRHDVRPKKSSSSNVGSADPVRVDLGSVGETHRYAADLQPTHQQSRIEAEEDEEDVDEEQEELGKEGSKDDQCWVFTHMHSSRGMMARRALLDRWKGHAILFDIVQWRRGECYAADLVSHSRWRVAHGGSTEALRRHGGATKCKWFTLFRHPIARLVSAFHHCRESPGDPLCATNALEGGDGMDLVAFAEHWGNFALRQFAMANVSFGEVQEWAAVAGRHGNWPSWYILKEYLNRDQRPEDEPEKALEVLLRTVEDVLLNEYAAVGIAEEYDTTMRLFDTALAMPGVDWSWPLQNAGKEKNCGGGCSGDAGSYGACSNGDAVGCPELGSAEDETLQKAMLDPQIQHFVKLDMLLYEHAVKVFRVQCSRYGVSTQLLTKRSA